MPPRSLVLPLCAVLIAGCGASTAGRGSTASSATAPSTPAPATSSAAPPSTPAAPSTTPAAASTTARPARTSSAPRHHAAPTTPAAPPAVSGAPLVVLNPGHNGGNASHPAEINRQVPAGYGNYKACDTTGTESNAGYPEHAFAWDVSLRVRRILLAHGVRVVLTRPNDTGVGPCVDERAAIGNHPDVAAVVSIHADGAPSSGHGFHVNQDSRRPDGATAAVARQSRLLGEAEHAALVQSSGLVPSTYIGQDGYFYRDDLAGLNLARRPATFLELGNMRNAGDAALLSSASGRARIAGAVAAGILAYLAGR